MQAVLVDGYRTPFLKAGTVRGSNAVEMAVEPIYELFRSYDGIQSSIDCVVGSNIGNQLLAPAGSNMARIIALASGVPEHVPAWTVNMNCASGLHAIRGAVGEIELGQAHCVLVPTVEMMGDYTAIMSREQRELYTRMLARARSKEFPLSKIAKILAAQGKIWTTGHKPVLGKNFGHEPLWLLLNGLTDPSCGLRMDKISDDIAEKYGITREEQDLFAYESHVRAGAARRNGVLAEEIVPFRGIEDDNGIRENPTLKGMKRPRPLHKGGTATPGNASQVTDGACSLLVASEDFAMVHGLPILAHVSVNGTAMAGCDPAQMGIGPAFAIGKLLKNTGQSLRDFDLIESNEAFAAVVIAQSKILSSDTLCDKHGIPRSLGDYAPEITNVNGGAIAIGHPLAASGSRLALTCAKELERRDKELGLVTLCIGGGQGEVMTIERRRGS